MGWDWFGCWNTVDWDCGCWKLGWDWVRNGCWYVVEGWEGTDAKGVWLENDWVFDSVGDIVCVRDPAEKGFVPRSDENVWELLV